MLLYPVSLLLLLYNRPTLLGSTRRSSFLLVVGTLLLALVLIGGVVAHDPMSIAYLAGYGSVLTLLAWTAAWWGRGMRWAWWVAEHGLQWRKGALWCVRMICRARTNKDVVILVKGDEVRLKSNSLPAMPLTPPFYADRCSLRSTSSSGAFCMLSKTKRRRTLRLSISTATTRPRDRGGLPRRTSQHSVLERTCPFCWTRSGSTPWSPPRL